MSTEKGLYLSDDELDSLEAEMAEAPSDSDGLINDTIRKKGAALVASGASKLKLRKELKLSAYAVNKLYKDEGFKKLIQDIGDDAVAAAKARARSTMARLEQKAMTALEKNLDKHSLEAVKTWLRAVGLDQTKDGDDKPGGFTLLLATQPKPEPKTVQVVREDEE
jgi:hypothetical protein